MRVHISQIISRRTGKAGHCVQLQSVSLGRLPVFGTSQGRLSVRARLVAAYLRQEQRQLRVVQHIGYTVLIIYRERLAPVALTTEYGVAQAIVHLHAAYSFFFYIAFGSGYRILHLHTVEIKIRTAAVRNFARLGVETLLRHIHSLYQRNDWQIEVPGEGIVAAVMSRHSHYSTRAVAGQHVIAHIDRHTLSVERIYSICTGKLSAYLFIYHALALSLALGGLNICPYGLTALKCCHLIHILALGSKYHECNAEHGVRARCEYIEHNVAAVHSKVHLRTLAPAYPVALRFFQRIRPVQSLKSFKQTPCICAHTQAPLIHHFLLNGESAAYA